MNLNRTVQKIELRLAIDEYFFELPLNILICLLHRMEIKYVAFVEFVNQTNSERERDL